MTPFPTSYPLYTLPKKQYNVFTWNTFVANLILLLYNYFVEYLKKCNANTIVMCWILIAIGTLFFFLTTSDSDRYDANADPDRGEDNGAKENSFQDDVDVLADAADDFQMKKEGANAAENKVRIL